MIRSRGALLLSVLLAACDGERAEPARTMEVERVVRDFLAEPGTWETVRSHPQGAPRVEVICPSYSQKTDGVDMPALVVPPPGEVRLVLGEAAAGSDPVRLVTRVGVDQTTFGKLSEKSPTARVAFEVRAGERVLAREVIELVRERNKENAWVDLGGRAGIELAGAREVTLRTEVLRPDGSAQDVPFGVRAGFGALRLVSRVTRPRAASSPAQPNVVLVVMDT